MNIDELNEKEIENVILSYRCNGNIDKINEYLIKDDQNYGCYLPIFFETCGISFTKLHNELFSLNMTGMFWRSNNYPDIYNKYGREDYYEKKMKYLNLVPSPYVLYYKGDIKLLDKCFDFLNNVFFANDFFKCKDKICKLMDNNEPFIVFTPAIKQFKKVVKIDIDNKTNLKNSKKVFTKDDENFIIKFYHYCNKEKALLVGETLYFHSIDELKMQYKREYNKEEDRLRFHYYIEKKKAERDLEM